MRLALTTPIRFEGKPGLIVGHCFKNRDLYDVRLNDGRTCLYVTEDKLKVTGDPMPADMIKRVEDVA